MRFLLLTPGTGHFFCGSCLRDNELAKALITLGHEVDVAPLYLPHVLEDEESETPVHMGGINMYLQQKSRFARFLPGFAAKLLDSPRLLRWASKQGNMTDASGLGEMTLSMLQGEDGRQVKELDKLVDWVATIEKPDVVVLSNVMLCGIARRVGQAIERPIVVTLQGESPFLDALAEPYRTRAWETLDERSSDVAAYVAVSEFYGNVMRERIKSARDRFHVVLNGIDLADFERVPPKLAERQPRTVGYLARMCPDKGLHTLVDAFTLLRKNPELADVQLRVAGVQLKEDKPYVAELEKRLVAAGVRSDAEFLPNVDRATKLAYLRSLSVLSVPATYGESFGLYVIEALASGTPVVQPRCAAFPELLDATNGGMLCEPDDPKSLAERLEETLLDPTHAQQLADNGRAAALERFTSTRMAQDFVTVCESVR